MTPGGLSDDDIVCQLLWRLARIHGWSQSIPIRDLVSQLNLPDEQRGRQVCRDRVATKSYIIFDQSVDEIRVQVPHDDFAYDLRSCGYSDLRIEATLSHFDGF